MKEFIIKLTPAQRSAILCALERQHLKNDFCCQSKAVANRAWLKIRN